MKLMDPKLDKNNSWFMHPVDINAFPDYTSYCPNPMDLNTVKSRLEQRLYTSPEEFERDVRTTFNNAIAFNKDSKERKFVVKFANTMLKLFDKTYSKELASAQASSNYVAAHPSAMLAPPPAPPMAGALLVSAQQIVANLKKHKLAGAFVEPVDTSHFLDYPARVPNPMALTTLQSYLQPGSSAALSTADFVRFLRRIPANSLRYTATFPTATADLRKTAQKFFEVADAAALKLVAQDSGSSGVVPLVCSAWRECLKVIDRVLREPGPTEESGPLALSFLHPIASYYPDLRAPSDYAKRVKQPMCLGDAVSNLLEGDSATVAGFARDVQLCFTNCRRYWTNHRDAADAAEMLVVCEKIERIALKELSKLTADFPSTVTASSSSAMGSASSQHSASSQSPPPLTSYSSTNASPPKPVAVPQQSPEEVAMIKVAPTSKEYRALKVELEKLVRDLEQFKSPIGVLYAQPFASPVDLSRFPDYLAFCPVPMDLSKMKRKIDKGSYLSPDALRQDMNLMFANAKAYNNGDAGRDVVTMANMLETRFESRFHELCQRLVVSRAPPPSIPRKAVNTTELPPGNPPQPLPPVPTQPQQQQQQQQQQPPQSSLPPAAPVASAERPKLKLKLTLGPRKAPSEDPTSQQPPQQSQPPPVPPASMQPPPVALGGAQSAATTSPPKLPKKQSPLAAAASSTIAPPQPMPPPELKAPPLPSSSSPPPLPTAGVPADMSSVSSPEWVLEASKVLARLMRHDWVSLQRERGARYCFPLPVDVAFPAVAADYALAIKQPSDLGTVESKLQRTRPGLSSVASGGFSGPRAFVEATLRVFANAIEYNWGRATAENLMPLELCEVANHLGCFFEALVLESPLDLSKPSVAKVSAAASDSTTATASSEDSPDIVNRTVISHGAEATPRWTSMAVTPAAKDLRRAEREALVLEAPVSDTSRECERLLKQLKMTIDKKHYWHFEMPINLDHNPTYLAVVGHPPTSRSECEQRLNRGQYATMGDLVTELRSVYSNALVFSGAGEKAGNKIARDICESARIMAAKLEEKLRVLVLDAFDRLGRTKVALTLDRARIKEVVGSHREKEAQVALIVDQQRALDRAEDLRRETHFTEGALARLETLQAMSGDDNLARRVLGHGADRLKIQSGVEQRRAEELRQLRLQEAAARCHAAATRHALATQAVWNTCRNTPLPPTPLSSSSASFLNAPGTMEPQPLSAPSSAAGMALDDRNEKAVSSGPSTLAEDHPTVRLSFFTQVPNHKMKKKQCRALATKSLRKPAWVVYDDEDESGSDGMPVHDDDDVSSSSGGAAAAHAASIVPAAEATGGGNAVDLEVSDHDTQAWDGGQDGVWDLEVGSSRVSVTVQALPLGSTDASIRQGAAELLGVRDGSQCLDLVLLRVHVAPVNLFLPAEAGGDGSGNGSTEEEKAVGQDVEDDSSPPPEVAVKSSSRKRGRPAESPQESSSSSTSEQEAPVPINALQHRLPGGWEGAAGSASSLRVSCGDGAYVEFNTLSAHASLDVAHGQQTTHWLQDLPWHHRQVRALSLGNHDGGLTPWSTSSSSSERHIGRAEESGQWPLPNYLHSEVASGNSSELLLQLPEPKAAQNVFQGLDATAAHLRSTGAKAAAWVPTCAGWVAPAPGHEHQAPTSSDCGYYQAKALVCASRQLRVLVGGKRLVHPALA